MGELIMKICFSSTTGKLSCKELYMNIMSLQAYFDLEAMLKLTLRLLVSYIYI